MESAKRAKILSGLSFIKWIKFIPFGLLLFHFFHVCVCVRVDFLILPLMQYTFYLSCARSRFHSTNVNTFAQISFASVIYTHNIVFVAKHKIGFGKSSSINRHKYLIFDKTQNEIHSISECGTVWNHKKNEKKKANTRGKELCAKQFIVFYQNIIIIYYIAARTNPSHIYGIDMHVLSFCQRVK